MRKARKRQILVTPCNSTKYEALGSYRKSREKALNCSHQAKPVALLVSTAGNIGIFADAEGSSLQALSLFDDDMSLNTCFGG